MNPLDEILTLADAAAELNLSPDTLRTQYERGRFEARLFGRTMITTRQEVERYRRESLGQVGRPGGVVPNIFAMIDWPDSGIDTTTLVLGEIDLDDETQRIIEEIARDRIRAGAWQLAEVLAALMSDPRLRHVQFHESRKLGRIFGTPLPPAG